jgi:hypothetical protein
VKTEVEGTPLIERISEDIYRRILEDSRDALASFRRPAGTAEISIRGHLITATKR